MNSLLKWGGIALGAVAGIALLAAGYIYFASEAVIQKIYEPRPSAFHAPSDAAAVARGAHLAVVTGCTDCH